MSGLAVDVAVAGAGPAGSLAAALLARTGRRVALIDRPDDGRQRIGESLPAAADRLLRRLGLPEVAADGRHRRVRGTLSAWGGPPVLQDALTSPEGPDWRLDRPAFDAALRAAALAAGAVPVTGLATAIRGEAGDWRLDMAGDRPVRAAFLIDATGRRAVVARRLGARRRGDAAMMAIWGVGAPRPADDRGTDRTLIEAVDEGWWYGAVLPDGRPLAALHGTPALARRMLARPDAWRGALAATALVGGRLGGAPAFDGVALSACDARGQVTDPPVGLGWAACGDAAVAFDPIAAQGLFNALATAADLAAAVGDAGRMAAYAERLAEVRRVYAARRKAAYARLAA